ncbi:MAG: NAD-dependent epimerase/dehydratase family protein, partial [Ignavibacterium sp.]|nr:NAD-dependent epimerase/dehydratase family protein [Ignavibacterium sp.]
MKNKKTYLAGHNGMVGSAIYKELVKSGYKNIVIKDFSELDLRNQSDVLKFFE